MKHLLKIAVVLIVGLLVAQPVLSSLSCAAGSAAACVPGCPMAMSSMAPDCSVKGMSAAEGCPQSCCTQNTLTAVLPKAATDKSRITISIPVAAFASSVASTGIEKPAAVSLEARADTPPRYILNRVFRI
jgi:hypothetical protein